MFPDNRGSRRDSGVSAIWMLQSKTCLGTVSTFKTSSVNREQTWALGPLGTLKKTKRVPLKWDYVTFVRILPLINNKLNAEAMKRTFVQVNTLSGSAATAVLGLVWTVVLLVNVTLDVHHCVTDINGTVIREIQTLEHVQSESWCCINILRKKWSRVIKRNILPSFKSDICLNFG